MRSDILDGFASLIASCNMKMIWLDAGNEACLIPHACSGSILHHLILPSRSNFFHLVHAIDACDGCLATEEPNSMATHPTFRTIQLYGCTHICRRPACKWNERAPPSGWTSVHGAPATSLSSSTPASLYRPMPGLRCVHPNACPSRLVSSCSGHHWSIHARCSDGAWPMVGHV